MLTATGHSIAYIQNILDYNKSDGKILATAPIIAARLNSGALSERSRMDLCYGNYGDIHRYEQYRQGNRKRLILCF